MRILRFNINANNNKHDYSNAVIRLKPFVWQSLKFVVNKMVLNLFLNNSFPLVFSQIIIEDINDNDPLFWSPNYVGSIIENNYPGKEILQVNASDADAGANARLHFWLPPDVTSKFTINETSGVISAATKLDYEQLKEVCIHV